MKLTHLVSLSISSVCIVDIEAKNFMIKPINFMMQHFVQCVISNMLFDLILTQELIILGILSKINLSIQ